MNQSQIKHIIARVDSIKESKISKFVLSNPKKINLTFAEKVEQIKTGKAILNIPVNCETYIRLVDCFVYVGLKEIISFNNEIESKVDSFRKELEKEVVRIKDELLLGDSQEALTLLRQFESN